MQIVEINGLSDPADLRRVEFNFENLKPEARLEIARGLSEMITSLAKAA